tara:strand:- start:1018 stop:1269 length:252 start_codon:yes stop_codon:yes gene_type:complete
MEDKPYIEQGEVRTFTQDVGEEELVWHRDREDRVIDAHHTTDWMFQFDNQLPGKITRSLFIPKNTYHRLIKGTGDLIIRVKKL